MNEKSIITLWRFFIMASNTANLFKGIGTGLAAGVMVGLVSSVLMQDKKKNKRKFNKAIDTVEGVLDTMQDIFK